MFLVLAILSGVLWMTSAAAAGMAKIVLALFLILFVASLFLRKGSSTKL